MPAQRTRQLAFRLPNDLIGRIEECERHIAETGLDVSRTDVVRLLLTYALNASACDLRTLIGSDARAGNGIGTGKDGRADAKVLERKVRRKEPVEGSDGGG